VARSDITTAVQSPRFGNDWWRRGIVYQIYPRSFADTDGNGVGDLQGIIDHLDHVGRDGLGVDAIWLSPIYPSPGLDVGYDVSDHTTVDPIFGSDADFDRLVSEAHRRGIRVVLDLVMNHTSDQHPWFVASRASRDGPFADWYLWRDPAA
jgi:glycosidase